MRLHSPFAVMVVVTAMIVFIGRCTVWTVIIMGKVKRGEISRFEGWASIAFLMGIAYSTIPLARWLGIVPRLPTKLW